MVFGLFRTSVPIFAREKAWAEIRMQWLWDELGGDRLLHSRMLTPEDAFPAFVSRHEVDMEACFDLVCQQMRIDPKSCEVRVVDSSELGDAAGSWEAGETRNLIRVRTDQLEQPESLVATLAHELAHEILAGGNYHAADDLDTESVADLLAVYCGCGLFTANSTVKESSLSTGTMSYWTLNKQGYLNSGVLGYACALYVWARNEPDSKWAGYLRPDAAVSFKQGLRYLQKTSDSLFRPHAGNWLATATVGELTGALRDASPASQIGILWALSRRGSDAQAALPQVTPLLSSASYEVRAAAARTLARLGGTDEETHHQLTRLVYDGNWQVRTAAALAIGQLQIDPDEAVASLARLVVDDDSTVSTAASLALCQFGESAAKAEKDTFASLHEALVDCDYGQASRLLAVASMCQTDMLAYLYKRFAFDFELRDQAVQVFETEVATYAPEDWRAGSAEALRIQCCPLA